MANPLLSGLLRVLRDAARPRARLKAPAPPPTRRAPEQPLGYPGDYTRMPEIRYDPHLDGRPDPGEVVWTWVPYEEDHTKGKDRPVLLIGRDGDWLLGLQVTSQDHDRDQEQEARAGRFWVDIGAGDWDSQRRPSEARVNRILRIDPDAVRRVGAMLDERTFRTVAREVGKHY
ncbi:hypothetical protein GCM10025789_19210 [Tessaracoccus lubricantis]|uniref:Growth inhibitor PemK n=1 Tax=Tessaracoccus lubricantis TaxID=545543 RepID=A0ABP9FLF9_9ACTN